MLLDDHIKCETKKMQHKISCSILQCTESFLNIASSTCQSLCSRDETFSSFVVKQYRLQPISVEGSSGLQVAMRMCNDPETGAIA